jgi:hypothetical protein
VRRVHALDVEGGIGLSVTRFCASFSTSAKPVPLSRISDRMKLLVPLMMPAIHSMRLAVSPSRSDLMMGMPPPTAASKATITSFFCAAAKISLPCCASSALFAVTTCLPLAIAFRIRSFADAGAADQFDDDVDVGVGHDFVGVGSHDARLLPARRRARSRSLSATIFMVMAQPARGARSLPGCAQAPANVPPPTVPMPSNPTLTAFREDAFAFAFRLSPQSSPSF